MTDATSLIDMAREGYRSTFEGEAEDGSSPDPSIAPEARWASADATCSLGRFRATGVGDASAVTAWHMLLDRVE